MSRSFTVQTIVVRGRTWLILFAAIKATKNARLVGFKGLAKLGNNVAETLFPDMFPWVAKVGNICVCSNVSATMFSSLARP